MTDERRRDHRVDVELNLRLAYGSVEEFIERWALNISRGGIFVRTLAPRPPGSAITLNVELESGHQLLRGDGVVRWVASPSAPGEPHRDPGMGIKFTRLEPESRALIARMVAAGASATEDEPPEPPGGPQAPADGAPGPGRDAAGPAHRPAAPRGVTVGIDLGTTNSCVALARDGRAEVLVSRAGHRTIPSVVAFDVQGRLLVGHAARAQMVVNPRNTVYGAKRLVGRAFHGATVQACRDRFHYDIIEGPGGEAAVRFAGREFTLRQVQAFVLRELKRLASEALGAPVERAVVTVPAHYGDAQRQAVRDAGALAGLEVVRIVNEPTAAALAFGYGKGLERRVLVYDLGGGTFDASLLDIDGDVYEVLSTGGDTFLGGVDFDSQLVDHLVWRFTERHGFVPPRDPAAWQRIRDAAEDVKIALSGRELAVARVPRLCRGAGGLEVDLEAEVSRAQLEELTEALVDRSLAVVREVLGARGVDPADVEDVLLVGGQSRMPLVWRKIRQAFRQDPNADVHPDEAVALGAALLADSDRRADSVVLIDVLPVSLGVGLPGGRVAPVFPRNTRLPARKSYEVATSHDGQEMLELALFQGESPRVGECEYLGTVRVERLPPGPRGSVRVALDFHVGAEGILGVRARNLTTGEITRAELRVGMRAEPGGRPAEGPEAPAQPAAGAAASASAGLAGTGTPEGAPPAAPPGDPGGDGGERPAGTGILGRIFGRR